MKLPEKIKIFSALIFLGILVSCNNTQKLAGNWKSEERDLLFNQNKTFEINYHLTAKIKGFRGEMKVTGNKLVLFFKEYETDDTKWHSLEGTDLENHKEEMRYSIIGNILTTYIEDTGKSYSYKRENENS